ncbi:hypothetical protein HK096_002102, partial [Nowakowskiella sp. JEL0078]
WLAFSVFSASVLTLGWISMALPWFYTPQGFFSSWLCIFFGFHAMSTTQLMGFWNLRKNSNNQKSPVIEMSSISNHSRANSSASTTRTINTREIPDHIVFSQEPKSRGFKAIQLEGRPRAASASVSRAMNLDADLKGRPRAASTSVARSTNIDIQKIFN